MADEVRDSDLDALGAELRAARGACPGVDQLAARADDGLDSAAAAAIDHHAALCPECADILALAVEGAAEDEGVDELTWRRAERGLDARAAPWATEPVGRSPWRRGFGAVAAILVAALAVGFWLARDRALDVPVPAATRGSALRPLAPLGPVDDVATFRWQAPPVELRFEVEIEQTGALVWRGAAGTSPFPAPPELTTLLTAGLSYRWRVRALAEDGHVVLASDWAEFELRPQRP